MKYFQAIAISSALFVGSPGASVRGGEGPPPAAPAWAELVERLAANAGQKDASLVRAFADRATSHTLDGKPATIDMLLSELAGVDWATTLTYRNTPESLAADLATAASTAPISDGLKQYLTPSDELSKRQANVTAMKWIGQQLKARADQPIGIILAHRASASAADGELIVVLVAGELVARDQYRFKQVAFGSFAPSN